jgi:hypothetical protein
MKYCEYNPRIIITTLQFLHNVQVCLPVYLSFSLFVPFPLCLCLSLFLSLFFSVCLSIFFLSCLPFSLAVVVCFSVCFFPCLPVFLYLSVFPVSLSVSPPLCLSFCPSHHLLFFLTTYVFLPLSHTHYDFLLLFHSISHFL